MCRAESKQPGVNCVIVFHHQRAVLTLDQLFYFSLSCCSSLLLLHLSLVIDCSSPKKQFDLSLTLLLTTHLALLSPPPPPHLPFPNEPLSHHALRCPLCQPSIRKGYEGSALLRGSSPRWILRFPRQPLMVKGELARSLMDPLQAGRHTDWLSLKKHHLCVPTGGGCN